MFLAGRQTEHIPVPLVRLRLKINSQGLSETLAFISIFIIFNMKLTYVLCYLFVLLSLNSLAAHNKEQHKKTHIYGRIQGSNNKMIRLANKPKGALFDTFKVIYTDSLISKSDSFCFTFKISDPTVMSLEVEGVKGWLPVILSPGNAVHIIGNIDSLYKSTVTGSIEDSLFRAHVALYRPFIIAMTTNKNLTPDSLNFYNRKIDSVRYTFLMAHKTNYVSLMIIYDLSLNKQMDSFSLVKNRSVYNKLSQKLKRGALGLQAYYNLFELPGKFLPGSKLPNFKFVDYKGKEIEMNELYKNQQYILIDFWATWCAPCIRDFVFLDSLYKTYTNKGFEIISYSYDVNKVKYESFMNQNDYKWIFITDLQADQSPVNKIFRINKFPSNFLVDKEGIILMVNADALSLKEFFKINLAQSN